MVCGLFACMIYLDPKNDVGEHPKWLLMREHAECRIQPNSTLKIKTQEDGEDVKMLRVRSLAVPGRRGDGVDKLPPSLFESYSK